MGYSFIDLGAEGCCLSLNALSINLRWGTVFHIRKFYCLCNQPPSEFRDVMGAQPMVKSMSELQA